MANSAFFQASSNSAFSAAGSPTIFVTSNQTTISPGEFQAAGSSVSMHAGSSTAVLVDGNPPSVSPAYFAVNLTGVTFSGGQFYLLLSTNGFADASPSDVRFAGPFDVSSLLSSPSLADGYYIGTANGTEYLAGPVAAGIAGGVYYVKVFDGSSSAVAVAAQSVRILPGINTFMASGPAGANVTLTGSGFSPNGIVNLTIQDAASSPTRVYYSRNVTASGSGTFVWSRSNDSAFAPPDLGLTATASPVSQPEGSVYFQAYDWRSGAQATARQYTEYYREFSAIECYDPGTGSYVSPAATAPFGNGTAVYGYVKQYLVLTGNFFNPSSGLTFTYDGFPLTPVSVTPMNDTGYFVANLTVPISPKGIHYLTVRDATGSLTVDVNVQPTLVVSEYIPMTVSYSLGGSSPPLFSYFLDGVQKTVPLTRYPTTYYVDFGSNWTVTSPPSDSSGGSWRTGQPTAGTADSAETLEFAYCHQYPVSFNYTVAGGSGPAPTVTYYAFGIPTTVTAGASVWTDAGSLYWYQDPLHGSTSLVRWYTPSPLGTVSGAESVNPTYYKQYPVALGYSAQGTGFGVPYVDCGAPVPANTTAWVDAGSSCSYPSELPGSGATERWATNATQTFAVTAPSSFMVGYTHQYFVGIYPTSAQGGAVTASGWYSPGSAVSLSASSFSGWSFRGWVGSAYTGNATEVEVVVNGPISERALFYPALTISAGGGSVSYAYGPVSGKVDGGASETIYVPPGEMVMISAEPSSPISQFDGWVGAPSGSGYASAIVVGSPSSLQATFGPNYMLLALISVLIVAGGVGCALVIGLSRMASHARHV